MPVTPFNTTLAAVQAAGSEAGLPIQMRAGGVGILDVPAVGGVQMNIEGGGWFPIRSGETYPVSFSRVNLRSTAGAGSLGEIRLLFVDYAEELPELGGDALVWRTNNGALNEANTSYPLPVRLFGLADSGAVQPIEAEAGGQLRMGLTSPVVDTAIAGLAAAGTDTGALVTHNPGELYAVINVVVVPSVNHDYLLRMDLLDEALVSIGYLDVITTAGVKGVSTVTTRCPTKYFRWRVTNNDVAARSYRVLTRFAQV